MGRKAKFGQEVQKKGPGRKAKKQKDPLFPKHLTGLPTHTFLNRCFLKFLIIVESGEKLKKSSNQRKRQRFALKKIEVKTEKRQAAKEAKEAKKLGKGKENGGKNIATLKLSGKVIFKFIRRFTCREEAGTKKTRTQKNSP